MTRRLVTALSVVLLAAACGSSAGEGQDAPATPTTTSPTSALSESQCADVVVLGVRGSGQAADRNRGVGREVLRTVSALAELVHDRTGASVRLEAVPYDASGTATSATYLQHVAAGARLARTQARDVLARCPATRLAAVGFSQGANVVHDLVDDLDAGIARRTVLAAMIADPQRDPSDSIRHWSYADEPRPLPHAGLLGAGRPVSEDVRDAAISLCTAGDEVCNDGGTDAVGGRTSATHRLFYEQPATAEITAEQLDGVLQANGS